MKTIKEKIRTQELLKIKKIVENSDGGKSLIILRTKKNIRFKRKYGLTTEDIKDIIMQLSVEDCFAGPERDRDEQYKGWVFKFNPVFEDTTLYIKIRIENTEKATCISVHEFGEYDGGEL